MAWPGIFQKLFANSGAGPMIRSDILPVATNAARGTIRPDNQTIFADADGVLSALSRAPRAPGIIQLLAFRASELPDGWYFANGDQYPLSSPQGQVLNSLPTGFKADWNIVVAGANINLPTMFYADGRGYFLRAVDGTSRQAGSIEQDQMRAITTPIGTGPTGTFTTSGSPALAAGGPWEASYQIGNYQGAVPTGGNYWVYFPRFNTARMGANYDGADTHGLNRGMTPAIFLGV